VRILYSHRIQSRDGQSVHVDEMVAAFRAEGHEVLVVGPRLHDSVAFGGQTRLVGLVRRLLPGALAELAELAYAVPAYLRLRQAYRRFKPDFVYERYNLFHLAGAFLARRGSLVYLEVNAPLAVERARHGGLGLPWLARAVERMTWRSASRVLAVTAVLRDQIALDGVDKARIEVVPNGIVPDRYLARTPPEPAATPVLGFVGFVREWHGLDEVLAAMADDGSILQLQIVGDGPARQALEQQAAALGLNDRVSFLGVVPPDRIPGLVSGFDIALQPRVTAYASPLKLFEYMAAGCAIVAPALANIREVVADGETALLFDPAAPGAMWQSVKRLTADVPLRRRLGDAARACALAHYTWRGNARRVAAWAAADLATPQAER
jgi:glycosyltransferase involved in cell wall biosynthesis